MVSFPGCKLNLGLQVLSKRTDGYHTISTCYYPLPWSDVLEALPSGTWSFVQTGLLVPGSTSENLCVKAYHLLKQDFDLPPVQLHLHKVIPMGAGLGGGSADAAHSLRLLNVVLHLKLDGKQLKSYAERLGSDCTFFMQDEVTLGSERGEVLEPVNVSLKGYYVVVVVPPIHVSTADAYKGVEAKTRTERLREILAQPVSQWKDKLTNDFESSVFQQHPEIARIKEKLYSLGALYASMSGSGSALFGIYDKEIDRRTTFPGTPGWSDWL